jgi:hypothetical protein
MTNDLRDCDDSIFADWCRGDLVPNGAASLDRQVWSNDEHARHRVELTPEEAADIHRRLLAMDAEWPTLMATYHLSAA